MPNWGELIALLPYVLVGTVVGPILTLIVLMWALASAAAPARPRPARRGPAQAVRRATLTAVPVFPVNVPYCIEHALIYPPGRGPATIDRADLVVACPVDGSLRAADIETCAACGTTFKLGAAASPLAIVTPDGPPEGGAAVA